jgi:cell division protein FtsI (penicillin-binding protein 3)
MVRGVAGVERVLEDRLVDPGLRGQPVALSIDSRVQSAMESELASAVTALNAEGGTGIVLDVRTGEVIAMASAPTFNPNAAGNSDPNALFNRATMGVYELGSAFKPITVAAAMEAGVITSMSQRWDATAPIPIGRFRISDDHAQNRMLSVPELLVHSSNIAAARIADAMGAERMQAAFRALGFDQPAQIELRERSRTLWPRDWGRATVLTSGFGHGIAITPLHLATPMPPWSMAASGGRRPDAGRAGPDPPGRRVYSERPAPDAPAAPADRHHGTGRNANVRASGSAARPAPPRKFSTVGGYNRQRQRFHLRGGFSYGSPRYVVLVMMDAPEPTAETTADHRGLDRRAGRVAT